MINALFYDFPDEPELFALDTQYLIGHDILVTPVLTEGATTVDGMFTNAFRGVNTQVGFQVSFRVGGRKFGVIGTPTKL